MSDRLIGSGIFLTPSQIAGHLPSPLMILLVWGLGGLITLTGALTFAELGSMFPETGGVYVYLKEGYGDLFGFLYGWAYLLVITTGAIAALTIACANYLAFIFPLSETDKTVIAVSAILVVTIVIQSIWAIVLLLFWGTFEDVITYVVFMDWIFFALTGACVIIFRVNRKDSPRPYKTLGYPFTPIIFVGISSLFVINTLVERPVHAWAGLIFTSVGVLVYYYFRKYR